MNNYIDELILESLSFYTPLTIDQIILDLDNTKIKNIPEFSLEILEKRIKLFIKEKRVKVLKTDDKITFIKLYPQKKASYIRFILYSLKLFKKFLFEIFAKNK